MAILTDFQKSVLRACATEPMFQDYYLTGGTALSEFYLGHRFSEDLYFFTEVPQGVARAENLINTIADKLGAKITIFLGKAAEIGKSF